MKEGWVSGEMRFSGAVEWVNDLGKTLTELHEIAHKKVAKYKAKGKNMTRSQFLESINLVRWCYFTPLYQQAIWS